MLKQRTIFFFWLPLALSWFLMTFEHPWVQGVIGRLPDSQLQLAAFGLILSLMILIETPIIMMLGTSAALSRNRQSYRLLWRYMMAANVYVTVVAAAMAFTPLLDWWLGHVVNVEQYIIDAVRPGIQIMVLWPAFIGYRRFHQGVMIRNGHTKPIGYGTVIRLTMSALTAGLVGYWTDMPGAAVGALALTASAFSEMLYVVVISRKDVRHVLETDLMPDESPLTYGGAFKFHFPLALTSLMTLLVRPVIERGIASTENAEAALAAWAVVWSVLLIARSGGMAWQEGVIALSEKDHARPALLRYSWILATSLTVALGVLAFSPLINLYIDLALQVPVNIQPLVILGAQVGILVPALTVFQSYYRGRLMHTDTTAPIYGAMFVSFGLTAATVWVLIPLSVNAIVVGTSSLLMGFAGEMTVLLWASHRQARLNSVDYVPALGD